MAYDITVAGAFSGRPAYQLRLYVRHNAWSGSSQQLAWALFADRVGAGTAWEGDARPWSVSIHGQTWDGSGALDFRSTTTITLAGGVTNFIPHDGNGNLQVGVAALMNASGGLFGSASASGIFVADRSAVPPGQPVPVGVSQITPVSLVYQWVGNGDNGGAPTTQWEVQWAPNDSFTNAGSALVPESIAGAYTIQNLAPGTTYWIRVRGQNQAGWSVWSGAILGTTLSGIRVGHANNGTFVGAAVYVGVNNAFALTEIRVGSGGQFVIPN